MIRLAFNRAARKTRSDFGENRIGSISFLLKLKKVHYYYYYLSDYPLARIPLQYYNPIYKSELTVEAPPPTEADRHDQTEIFLLPNRFLMLKKGMVNTPKNHFDRSFFVKI